MLRKPAFWLALVAFAALLCLSAAAGEHTWTQLVAQQQQ
jgi:hypothetical protein